MPSTDFFTTLHKFVLVSAHSSNTNQLVADNCYSLAISARNSWRCGMWWSASGSRSRNAPQMLPQPPPTLPRTLAGRVGRGIGSVGGGRPRTCTRMRSCSGSDSVPWQWTRGKAGKKGAPHRLAPLAMRRLPRRPPAAERTVPRLRPPQAAVRPRRTGSRRALARARRRSKECCSAANPR